MCLDRTAPTRSRLTTVWTSASVICGAAWRTRRPSAASAAAVDFTAQLASSPQPTRVDTVVRGSSSSVDDCGLGDRLAPTSWRRRASAAAAACKSTCLCCRWINSAVCRSMTMRLSSLRWRSSSLWIKWQRGPYGHSPVVWYVLHRSVLYLGWRTTGRSSARPWANWHLSPYLHAPFSSYGRHNSVLYRQNAPDSRTAEDDDGDDGRGSLALRSTGRRCRWRTPSTNAGVVAGGPSAAWWIGGETRRRARAQLSCSGSAGSDRAGSVTVVAGLTGTDRVRRPSATNCLRKNNNQGRCLYVKQIYIYARRRTASDALNIRSIFRE